MQAARIEGATRVLAPPDDWDAARDGPCARLYVRDQALGQAHAMASAWFPTAEEVIRLVKGAPVHLVLVGCEHPPVRISVGEPPDSV